MSVCQISPTKWYATGQLSSFNCCEIVHANGELSIKRLFTQAKPRVGNRLIFTGDYIYNIGGREYERPQKSVDRMAVADWD